MAIQKVKRLSVSDQVFEQLQKQLIGGEWNPGDKLPSENELSKSFGVSRVTVRQAIQRLAALGLLDTKLGEGTFVKAYTPGALMSNMIPLAYLGENTLLEVLEFRKIIEAPTAELAARKATDSQIRTLEQIYDRMVLAQGDKHAFFRTDFDFHLEIANIANNSMVIKTYGILRDVLEIAMERVVDIRGPKQGLYYHKLLLGAMKEHNPQKCREIMDSHIADNYDSIAKQLNAANAESLPVRHLQNMTGVQSTE